MVSLNKKAALLIAIVFSLACAQIVSAAVYYSPTYANVSENFVLNVTVSAPANTNISQIIIINNAIAFNYLNTTNATTSSVANISQFIDAQSGNVISRVTWMNVTALSLVANATNQSFRLTLNSSIANAPAINYFTVCMYNSSIPATFATRACDTSDEFFVEAVNITFGIDFGFSGTIKLENGSVQPSTNVSIYDYVTSVGGPPTETLIKSVLSDANGEFRLWGINGSKSLYKMKMIWKNGTAYNERAHYIGSNLPPFPGNIFYPIPLPPGSENMPLFKKMPTINGSTFYLQSAATINISAKGNTTGGISVKFGYEVIDQAVGFPIESNVKTGVWSQEVIVPIGRSYTAIAMRDPVTFPSNDTCTAGGAGIETVVGQITPDTCPAPPTSVEIVSANLTQGGYVQQVMNLSFSIQHLSGCLNILGNTSKINITNVMTRLTPWTGFVPPIDAKISAFNISNSTTGYGESIVYGDSEKCSGSLAFYNMSLMGSSNGVGYLIEFYGKNASDTAGSPGSAVNLAAFQNLTMNESSRFMNITLKPLAGAYIDNVAGAALNTTKMKIFVHNSSGSTNENAITTSMHVEIKVKHPIFGTMHYIVEDISGGIAYLPILANSTWAKVSVYPNQAPPVEKKLNLLATQNNITVLVGDFTFRKPLSNGSLQSINVSNKGIDASTGINMTFYRNSAGCNTPNPPVSCLLTQMDANDFNPMVVMLAGKVNLELKMTSSGTTLYFINFDLLSAKPPTNSIMNNNATGASASAQTQAWEQGSFVPHVYDYAYVVMPYSVSSGNSNYINESYTSFSMSIPHFKDENWAVVWNRTLGNTTAQLPDDYTDYNVGAYASLLTAAGTTCSTTNTTDVCYWDKGNNSFVLKVPHFSGVGSTIAGSAPAAASATTTTSSSSGTSSTAAETESRTFSHVAANSENTYRVSNSADIGVNAVIFTTTEDLDNVKITLKKLNEKPSSVSATPDGKLYRYIEIDAPKLESKTKEAKIQFEVTKAWLEDNGYEPEHARLARFVDGSWRELTTSIITEETSRVYYEAISPGFSYFAITAKKTEVKEEETAESVTAPSETPAAPELPPAAPATDEGKTGIVKTLLIAIGILVVLFLAVLGYKKKNVLVFWREPTDKERQEYVRGEFLRRKKQQSWGGGSE